MNGIFRKTAVGIVVLATISLLPGSGARAAVRTGHPRIWLDPETKTELIARLNANTPAAQNLVQWCASHRNDDLSGYTSSRAVSVLEAINFALLYQLQGNTDYAARAAEIIEYVFAHPYPPYTIDTWITFDNYYTTRYLVPPVAIVLDWCWDYLSQNQRDLFIAQLDTWLSMVVQNEPWAWYDPSNNFYHGYTWAFLAAGYAMYGHHANAQGYIDYARDVMLENSINYTKGEHIDWPHWDNSTGRAKGGLWNEGTSYGCVNNEFICSAVLAVRSAEGIERPDFTFPSEALRAYIYATHPDNRTSYSDGDGATTGTIDATIRVPLLLCSKLSSGDIQRYAQYWLNHYSTRTTWGYKLYHEFMWYDESITEADYHGVLPDYYYLEGIQTLFWRSDWTDNACWIALKLGLLDTDHAHNGLGNFEIWQNGFLAADKGAATGNSMLYGDADHNVLLIPTSEDKKLYWGATVVEHRESTADYIYLAGDLSGPYLAQPDYRNNVVTHKEREFFLIKADRTLVVMDRGSTSDAAVTKTVQIYVPATPTADGEGMRVTNGTRDLVVKAAWPAEALVSSGSDDMPLIRVTTPSQSADKTFLTVVRATERNEALNTAQVEINDSWFAAAAFQGNPGTMDYVVAFSNAYDGSTPAFDTLVMQYMYYSLAIRVFVADLEPNTTYYTNSSVSSGIVSISVSTSAAGSSGSATTSAEGVLSLLVYPEEEPQPTPTPSGVKID